MRISLLLTLLLFHASIAFGAPEKSDRSYRILFLNPQDDSPKKLQLFDGVSFREVELSRMGFSPVYQIRAGDLTLAMLSKLPEAPAKEGALPVIPPEAPKAAIPAAMSDFYLIVSSDPSNKIAPVKLQVINADLGSFPPGHMLWFNLTESKVAGMIGSSKLLIAPNSRVMLSPPTTKMEDYNVDIYYISSGKERPEPLCETQWSHDPRSRSVYFIVKPTKTLIPRIIGFPDFREVEVAKSSQ